MKRAFRFLPTPVFFIFLSMAAAAQPVSGDLVIADSASTTLGRVYSRASSNGALTTIYGGFAGFFPNWISMAPDNRSMFVPFADGQNFRVGFLANLTPSGILGILSTLGTAIGYSNGQEPAGDGTYINAGNQGILFSFNPSSLALTTLDVVPALLNDVALNRDDGTYMCLVYPPLPSSNPGTLIKFDPANTAITTLIGQSAQMSRPSGIVQDPTSGDFIITRFPAPGGVRVNGSTLAITSLWTSSGANALALTPRNTFLISTETVVQEVDGIGTVLRTSAFPVVVRIMGVAEYGSRRVATSGPATPGTSVTVDINSGNPSDAGNSYFLAMSLSTRPAVVGAFPNGEVLNLAADPLFFVTATGALPGLFVNFQGTLDAQSHATASVRIPAAVPGGLNLPLNIGGVVTDAGAPGGVSTVLSSVTFVLR